MNWLTTIQLSDIWRDDTKTVQEKAKIVVQRIVASDWLSRTPHPDTLRHLLDELEMANTASAFDEIFDEVYNLADEDAVWIDTTSRVVEL